ncbi:hypothetical protein ACWD7T_33190 [Streptomyces sp. 900116325]
MTSAALDTPATDYQARLLLAALDDSERRIPSGAKARTLEIMSKRQWIRARRLASTLASVESGAKDHVLTHHGVNAANKVKATREAAEAKKAAAQKAEALQGLAERFPVDSAAVYVPEPAESYRDVVIVKSGPAADGKVDAISGRYNGKSIRVALDKLEQLPPLAPAPEGEPTDWWGIFDREGNEITQVEATGYEHARQEAEKDPKACAKSLTAGGLVYRRLRSSEVKAQEPPKATIAAAVPARRTITVTTGFTRKSIPTRLRESGAPGRMQYSEAAGALRWVLPNGKELTPGEAAKLFLN